MKPFSFIFSVIFTLLLLIGGAALAASVKGTKEIKHSSESYRSESNRDVSTSYDRLSIEVKGIRSSDGRVLVMIFDNSMGFENYDHTKAIGYQEVDAQGNTLVFSFSSLTDGPYAVFVMHDENNDYQLNQREGYPVEGFAVSGAKTRYDEPTFKQASVAKGDYALRLVYF